MPGSDLLQVFSAPESLNQPILLFRGPCLARGTALMFAPARTRGSLLKSRAAREHCADDIGVLQEGSGRKVVLCEWIYTVHQRLKDVTCLLISHSTSLLFYRHLVAGHGDMFVP